MGSWAACVDPSATSRAPIGGRERREPRHEGGQRLDGQRVDRLHGRQRGEIGPIYHRAS